VPSRQDASADATVLLMLEVRGAIRCEYGDFLTPQADDVLEAIARTGSFA